MRISRDTPLREEALSVISKSGNREIGESGNRSNPTTDYSIPRLPITRFELPNYRQRPHEYPDRPCRQQRLVVVLLRRDRDGQRRLRLRAVAVAHEHELVGAHEARTRLPEEFTGPPIEERSGGQRRELPPFDQVPFVAVEFRCRRGSDRDTHQPELF